MSSIILFLLFWGWCITTVIVNGSIFDNIKNYLLVKAPFFHKLLTCVMCTGFWIGLIVFYPLLFCGNIDPIFSDFIPGWMSFLIFPFLQSGFSVLVESFLIFLVKKTDRS